MKGWRTVGFNVATVILAILAAPEFQAVLPEGWERWALMAVAVGNIILRAVTTTPMGHKR